MCRYRSRFCTCCSIEPVPNCDKQSVHLLYMPHVIENSIINGVLCYLSSSRNSVAQDTLITHTVGFYKSEDIKSAKELFFKVCNEAPIKRKACTSHPNPAAADVKDILNLFYKKEESDVPLPAFLSADASMPPSAGFDAIAVVLCSLRDEVSMLRCEVTQVRETTQNDLKALEGVTCVVQDVTDIKTLLHAQREALNKITSSSVPAEHESASNRSDDISAPSLLRRLPEDPMSQENQVSQLESGDEENPWHLVQQRNRRHGNPHRTTTDQRAGMTRGGTRGGGSGRGGYGYGDVDRGAGGRGHVERAGPGRAWARRNSGSVSANVTWRDVVRGNSDENPRGNPNFGSRGHGEVRRNELNGRSFRSRNILGTRSDNATGLTGVQHVMEVFIGGCGLDTVEADINSHCQANGISPKKCEAVSTVSEWQKSFKLSVLATDRDKVMTSDFWPMGVYVRKYFAKRSPRT